MPPSTGSGEAPGAFLERFRAEKARTAGPLLVWAGATLALTWALFGYWLGRRRALGRGLRNAADGGAPLPGPWRRLRAAVRRAGYRLTPGVFAQIRRLYLSQYAHGRRTPAALTREYHQDEYLRVVDGEGRPSPATPAMLREWRATVQAQPGFERWLRAARLADGTPVLLAARWLCHLAGLCHPTVEIFIDPPGLAGHTLVQVRGMGKFEAPGAWDIPCAGHVSGVDAVETALRKELAEELNLALEDLADLRQTGRYASTQAAGTAGGVNNEYRVLYQATLRPGAAGNIRFSDGEVAGLAVFAVPELRQLVQRRPGLVASGLSGAMAFYQAR